MARRLLLSYLAIISVTVILILVIVNIRTSQTFSRYLSDQALTHSRMLPVMLAGHFTERGTWEGVQPSIDEASMMIGLPVTLVNTQGTIVAATDRSLVGQSYPNAEQSQSINVVGREGRSLGVVYLGRNLAQERADQAFLDDITSALVATGVAVALLAMGVAVLLSRSISQPLAAMAGAAMRIAKGDYSTRVASSGGREIATLAEAFNQMAEGIGSLEHLRRTLVANVSHDLRTPLTVIRGYLEGLRSGHIADRRSAELAFEAMHMEVNRLLHMVEDLRHVAKQDSGVMKLDRQPTALHELTSDAIQRVGSLIADKQLSTVNAVPSNLPPILLDWEQMSQALFNLLENAINHTPTGGQIVLEARQAQGSIFLEIRDTGVGIAPEHLPHIFERFYRADQARSWHSTSGLGLGLAIVRGIVEAHGGDISVCSTGIPGQGTMFTLRFPL